MEFKTNTGAIVVTIIILIIAIPKTGYLMDYRLDYCNDLDKIEEGLSGRTIFYEEEIIYNTEPVDITHEGFFACEIGFINANVEIIIDVIAIDICKSDDAVDEQADEDGRYASYDCGLDFFILNKDNYLNFVQGESYIETNSLYNFWSGSGSEQIYASSSNLLYDSYYFVMNWEYRTTKGEEFSGYPGYSRDYAGAYTTIWNDDSDFSFYYALDIDYTDDNLKGNL